MKWLRTLVTFTLAAMPVSQSFATQVPVATDDMIEGAKLCTRHLPRYEREYAIPTHLLSAIASTESGRYHEGLRMKLPWPWSINAEGKGYYFDTKEDAIAAVRKLQAHGIQSIDVGCMQVNLYQHPQAFSSLSEAFEPQANIAYAASFLRSLYDEGGTWKKAAAHYHSRTPSLGSEYVNQVYDSWYTIIDKLRAARLQVPESSVAAMKELKNPSYTANSTTRVAASASPHVIHIASAEPVNVTRPESVAREVQPASYEPARMNSIRVTSEADSPPREYSNIIVIPASRSTPVAASEFKTADSTPMQSLPAAVVARTDAPLTVAPVVTPIAIPASLNPAAANSAPAPAVEIKTADSTPLQTPIQHAVQTLANPATDANVLSELSPAAGRHVLAVPSDQRSGPSFIFND